MRKLVISFSVYGDNDLYYSGAIANAVAIRQFFPGWVARFYVDNIVAAKIRGQLENLGSEVIQMCRKKYPPMFWRFLAAGDQDIDTVIVRDVDALLCPRDWKTVRQWLNSSKKFHIIRDQPNHRSLIMCGLWGCKGGILKDIHSLINDYKRLNSVYEFGDDQRFLSIAIYPIISNSLYVSTDFIAYGDEIVHPIKLPLPQNRWLGFPATRIEMQKIRIKLLKTQTTPDSSQLQRFDFKDCPFTIPKKKKKRFRKLRSLINSNPLLKKLKLKISHLIFRKHL